MDKQQTLQSWNSENPAPWRRYWEAWFTGELRDLPATEDFSYVKVYIADQLFDDFNGLLPEDKSARVAILQSAYSVVYPLYLDAIPLIIYENGSGKLDDIEFTSVHSSVTELYGIEVNADAPVAGPIVDAVLFPDEQTGFGIDTTGELFCDYEAAVKQLEA